MKQSFTESPPRKARLADQVESPYPIDQPDRQFQRASPVHAHAKRALPDPRIDLFQQSGRIFGVPRRPVRPAQDNQLMMTIRLPYELRIARLPPVPVIDGWRKPHGCLNPPPVIAVPVDGIPQVVIREIEKTKAVGNGHIRLPR